MYSRVLGLAIDGVKEALQERFYIEERAVNVSAGANTTCSRVCYVNAPTSFTLGGSLGFAI
jgi:hypothetical protein